MVWMCECEWCECVSVNGVDMWVWCVFVGECVRETQTRIEGKNTKSIHKWAVLTIKVEKVDNRMTSSKILSFPHCRIAANKRTTCNRVLPSGGSNGPAVVYIMLSSNPWGRLSRRVWKSLSRGRRTDKNSSKSEEKENWRAHVAISDPLSTEVYICE